MLPGEGKARARQVAEQIRAAVFAMGLPHPRSASGLQTISLGMAALDPDPSQNATELIGMADLALYRAKDLGRNQVAVA